MSFSMEPQNTYYQYTKLSEQIHLIVLTQAEPVEDLFAEYINFALYSARETKGAWIIDISKARYLPEQHRKILTTTIKSCYDLVQKNWTSVAYVNTSIMPGVLLEVIEMDSPLPIPTKVFGMLETAIEWSQLQLKEKLTKERLKIVL
jgi:hypothetical protein